MSSLTDTLWTSFGEEYRHLRTKLIEALGRERNRIVMVTSAAPKEGKTSLAVNLARSLARSPWKTVLLDADLRHPDLHRIFKVERAPGLAEAMALGACTEEHLRGTGYEHMSLIPAGGTITSPPELIDAPPTAALFRDLAQRYDYVVVDAPPVLSITDTVLLSRYVHAIILVVEAGRTPKAMIMSAMEELRERPVVGVALNMVKRSEHYYGYYAKDHY